MQVGDIKTTETLLKGGIDANRLGDANVPGLNQFMWGPVHCAAFYAQRGCLDLLVEFGADVECPDTLYKGVYTISEFFLSLIESFRLGCIRWTS